MKINSRLKQLGDQLPILDDTKIDVVQRIVYNPYVSIFYDSCSHPSGLYLYMSNFERPGDIFQYQSSDSQRIINELRIADSRWTSIA